MKKVLLIGLLTCFLSISAGISKSEAADAGYVGNKACAECHKIEAEEWKTSKHSKAFERLQLPDDKREAKKRKRLFSKLNGKLVADEKLDLDKDYSKEKKCLPCHTVGFDKSGGFKDVGSTPELVGVGCENCHGPGSAYAPIHKKENFTRAEAKAAGATYGSEDEKVCRQCHDKKESPIRSEIDEKYKFDWNEFLSLEKTYHKRYPLKRKH